MEIAQAFRKAGAFITTTSTLKQALTLVVARHPRRWTRPASRSISEFYYVIRTSNEWDLAKRVSVIGPLDELEFNEEKKKLRLPEFSIVFDDLK
jgi:hypothetical protein